MERPRCKLPGDMIIRFGVDGDIDLDPCLYEEVDIIKHCTVHILRCKRCGHIEIEWEREGRGGDSE